MAAPHLLDFPSSSRLPPNLTADPPIVLWLLSTVTLLIVYYYSEVRKIPIYPSCTVH